MSIQQLIQMHTESFGLCPGRGYGGIGVAPQLREWTRIECQLVEPSLGLSDRNQHCENFVAVAEDDGFSGLEPPIAALLGPNLNHQAGLIG